MSLESNLNSFDGLKKPPLFLLVSNDYKKHENPITLQWQVKAVDRVRSSGNLEGGQNLTLKKPLKIKIDGQKLNVKT